MTGRSLLERFDQLLGQPVATRSIAVLRACVGVIALVLLWPIASDAWSGTTYHDRFHEPFLDLIPQLPAPWFGALMSLGAAAAVAMVAGLATRVACAVTTVAVGAYVMASTTHLHNNRAYLFAVLVGVSLAAAGRSWSLDRWLARRRGTPRPETMAGWPLWLLRFTCSLVYASSAVSKLIDPDWIGGTVTWGRVVKTEVLLRASILPEFAQDLLLERSFHTFAAKVIVLTELFIAVGLWWRPSRVWAVIVAIGFHISIELSASVQTFSYLAIAVLIVWADPALEVTHRGRASPRVAA